MKIGVISVMSNTNIDFLAALHRAEAFGVRETNGIMQFDHWFIQAPKIHKENEWKERDFQFLSDMRNSLISLMLKYSVPDWAFIVDDDVLVNPNLFKYLPKVPSYVEALSFHHYSYQFKRELLTQQTPEAKTYGERVGKATEYKNIEFINKLPSNIYPDQTYLVKASILQKIQQKHGDIWFWGLWEARGFVEYVREFTDWYIMDLVNDADYTAIGLNNKIFG